MAAKAPAMDAAPAVRARPGHSMYSTLTPTLCSAACLRKASNGSSHFPLTVTKPALRPHEMAAVVPVLDLYAATSHHANVGALQGKFGQMQQFSHILHLLWDVAYK